jgi:hypothetical protein
MTNFHTARSLVAGHAHDLQSLADSRRRWFSARRSATQAHRAPLAAVPSRTTEAAVERVAA